MEQLRMNAFLHALRESAGKVDRAAQAIGVSPRTFSTYLTKSDDELAALHLNYQDLQRAAQSYGISLKTFEVAKTLWDDRLSYEGNLNAALPPPADIAPLSDLQSPLLGKNLSSCFGVGSGVVTADAGRVRFLFESSCAIATYKTIRARDFPPVPGHNLLYCSEEVRTLDPHEPMTEVGVGERSDRYKPEYGTVNHFRIPSPPQQQLRLDIKRANHSANDNQLFILSVVGASPTGDADEIMSDFRRVVQLGQAAGVTTFELNLGCPTEPVTRLVLDSPRLAIAIAQEVRNCAREARILIKMPFAPIQQLERLMLDTTPFVDGWVAINTVPVRAVLDGGPHGKRPAFGVDHPVGIAGRPVLECGLHIVNELASIRERNKISRKAIIGLGGVTRPADVVRYRDAGADAVQAVTIFHADPYFAVRVHEFLASNEKRSELSRDKTLQMAWHNIGLAMEALAERGFDRRRVAPVAMAKYTEFCDRFDNLNPNSPRRPWVPTVNELVKDIEYLLRGGAARR
jgi:dihydroorotate dehydrogenase (NAD+) catalytic subunit